ncbi:MAG: hypothetical protein KAJ20_00830 [Candidatus Aenigmarchaeota archaeon]|nr:hypothetical protein [Candidatus Aenigmarchaeota archaeon]MCK5372860.1 hypothetical protein [Candidatus Aenigmarchaeota archaeon]
MPGADASIDETVRRLVDADNVCLVLPVNPGYKGMYEEAIGRIYYRDREVFTRSATGTIFIREMRNGDSNRIDDLENYTFSGSLKVKLSIDDAPDVLYMEILENPSRGELKEGLLLQVGLIGLS